jgi:hypothetical protein
MRPTLFVPAAIAALLTACSNDSPTGLTVAASPPASLSQSAGSPIDISGSWHTVDRTFLVSSWEGVMMHLSCVGESVLTITQTGAAFTGTVVGLSASCTTQDGQVIPAPWPNESTLTGRITGRGFQFDQYDAPPNYPVHCPGTGTIEVRADQAVALKMEGRCDLLFTGIRPIVARSYSTATRL